MVIKEYLSDSYAGLEEGVVMALLILSAIFPWRKWLVTVCPYLILAFTGS
jgi:hypothetical protein